MIAYIDVYRDQFGVERICRVLGATDGGFMTARGYRAAKARPVSDRSVRDAALIGELERVHRENYSVYGVRKMHAAMRRAGWLIGRDQTARLMRIAGLAGITRGATRRTTHGDPSLDRPDDRVQRNFHPAAPRRLWVADITYVPTWSGMAYAAFVIDAYSRRICGWAVSGSMRTEDLPLQALDHALWRARDTHQLIHHSDRGSQYLSIRYTDRLAEHGIAGSVGSRGDSYDNALAESIIGLFKTELIKTRRPWRTIDDVEIATLHWVWWFNHQRLHSELGYHTPIETEQAYDQHQEPMSVPTETLVNT